MFLVDGGNESGVVYTDRNIDKCDESMGYSTGEFNGRMENLEGKKLFA